METYRFVVELQLDLTPLHDGGRTAAKRDAEIATLAALVHYGFVQDPEIVPFDVSGQVLRVRQLVT